MSENASACAATTTIREALHEWVGGGITGMADIEDALAALALLEQLVEAAQVDVAEYLEWRAIPGNEHKSAWVMDNLAAAVAAVGPGEEAAQ